MADQATGERTEQPTERRVRESRERGQVARSRELETTAVLLTGVITLLRAAIVSDSWVGRQQSHSPSVREQ